MAGFYNIGEKKNRPGLYMRIVNRGTDAARAAAAVPVEPEQPDHPELTDELTVAYSAGVVTLTLPKGSTVSYDGAGTVTLSGLESVAYDDEGNVTIGG